MKFQPMDDQVLFAEKQKFTQAWVWVLVVAINLLFLYGIYRQLILGEQFGNNPMTDTGLLLSTGVVVLISLMLFNFRLHTIISREGISVRLFPFHIRYRHYPWESISKAYIRKYSPLKEYGGWGIRMGLGGKGIAFNASGNMGLQLEFTNGKKLLLGTNKPEELAEALKRINQ